MSFFETDGDAIFRKKKKKTHEPLPGHPTSRRCNTAPSAAATIQQPRRRSTATAPDPELVPPEHPLDQGKGGRGDTLLSPPDAGRTSHILAVPLCAPADVVRASSDIECSDSDTNYPFECLTSSVGRTNALYLYHFHP